MKLGTWLLAMCEPLLAKILLTLGFSVVSIVGVEISINALRDQVVSGLNSMPSVWLDRQGHRDHLRRHRHEIDALVNPERNQHAW